MTNSPQPKKFNAGQAIEIEDVREQLSDMAFENMLIKKQVRSLTKEIKRLQLELLKKNDVSK